MASFISGLIASVLSLFIFAQDTLPNFDPSNRFVQFATSTLLQFPLTSKQSKPYEPYYDYNNGNNGCLGGPACNASPNDGHSSVTVSISPNQGPVGTIVRIHGRNFSANNTITFAGPGTSVFPFGMAKNVPSSNSGTVVVFKIPKYVYRNTEFDPASNIQASVLVIPGVYLVTVFGGPHGVSFGGAAFNVTAGP